MTKLLRRHTLVTGACCPCARRILPALVASVLSTAAFANPTGGTVVSGDASIVQTSPSTLTVTNSPGAILNWQSFSIAVGETTKFVQQSSTSAVLNRVVGQDPSQILGTLQSNGRVYLINPNGIIFGQGAVIDVAGLIASTLNIKDADFLAGQLKFEAGPTAGSIVNDGVIRAGNRGEVFLIAPEIRNNGTIEVENGQIVLAAGRKVTITSLDLDHISFEVQAPEDKVVNLGSLIANGGAVGVFAGQIEQKGVISATRIAQDSDGRIRLAAADGVEIRYDVAGTGDTTLVFVHCWTCNRRSWDESFAYFSKDYRVVRLDLAGHGESGKGRKHYTMGAFGGDVAAVADKLGLKRIVLIGHSMGGPVSLEAEKRLGARVIGVVGVDTFHISFPMPKNDKEVAAFMKPFEDDFKGHGKKFMHSMFTPQSDPVVIKRVDAMVSGVDQTMAIDAIKNIFAWYRSDAAASFARVGDRLRNINADPKGENKPLDKSVMLIAGVGHFVAQEKPAEFNRVLESIVAGFESATTKK